MSLLRKATSLLNGVGAAAKAVGLPVARLDPDELELTASRQEGHDDFGNPAYRKGLEVLVDSAERDANLHTLGRMHMRGLILELLVTRLRLSRVREKPPAPAKPLLPPLVVCGLPRSGTTFLHRMLAERADARPLPLWELREPIPERGKPDDRLARARARDKRLATLLPDDADAQHLVRAELPDECGHLLKVAFWSSLFWQVPAYRYLEWYLAADPAPAYRDYRALLDVLARPNRRLVLKDPFHARHLDQLLTVLPDAMVVQTHRDPVEIVPSFHKLATTYHALLSDRFDRQRTIALDMRWLQAIVHDGQKLRAQLGPRRVFDVEYRELLADPLGVVSRLHAHFGLELDANDRSRIARFITENPQHKHGRNRYTAADFGQRDDEIAAAFAGYQS
jgi:hypothetical protein